MFDVQKTPIGLYEKALPSNLSLKEKLQIAKECGYDFFEISIDETDEKLFRLDWDKTKKLELIKNIHEIELPVLSMCLSGHRRFPMGSLNLETRTHALDIMKKAINFAVETGIRIIQLAGYDVYYEQGNEETRQLFIDGLRKSTEWAGKAGVMLAIEIMDSEFINSIEKAMVYVKEINSPWLKVYPDIGNMSAWGNDFDTDFNSGVGHIAAIHIKETRSRIHRDVAFGDGTVDFFKAFSKISEINFTGPFLIEMWADSSKDPVLEAKRSLEWVKKEMHKGGIPEC